MKEASQASNKPFKRMEGNFEHPICIVYHGETPQSRRFSIKSSLGFSYLSTYILHTYKRETRKISMCIRVENGSLNKWAMRMMLLLGVGVASG